MTHDERRARHCAMWFEFRNGYTLSDLVRRYGMGREYIHRIVRQAAPPYSDPSVVSPDLIQEMHQPVDGATKRQIQRTRRLMKGPDARDLRMMEMYRAGLTLQQIGTRYGITRERVRQLLRKHGCAPTDGGSHIRGVAVKVAKAADRDQRYLARTGCTFAEWSAIGSVARRAYSQQHKSAAMRGIGWSLTLKQWWDLWQQSGHWSERGIGRDRYCMARVRDVGDYAFGNVYITTCRENGQEYAKHRSFKRSETPGVYHMYPGVSRGYLAKHSNTYIGTYKTRDEAVAARAAYLARIGKVA